MPRAALLLTSLILTGSFCAHAEPTSPRTDSDGEPLPRGAIARLGSARWRVEGEVRNFYLAPNGRTLAVTTSEGWTEVLDTATGARLRLLGERRVEVEFPPTAFSADGKTMAHLDVEERGLVLKIRSLDDKHERSITFQTHGRVKSELPPEVSKKVGNTVQSESPSALAFSPDGKFLAAAVRFYFKCEGEKGQVFLEQDENVVHLWDIASGKELLTCTGHKKAIRALFFARDGKTLTTASEDGTVRFWDAATGKEKRRPWKAEAPLFCAAYSPDGKWFAAGSKKTVLLWDAASGELRHRLAISADAVSSLAFTPDSKLLAAGGGTMLRLWEPDSAKMVQEKSALPHPITALAFAADGQTLFLGQEGELVVRRLKTATLKPQRELNGHAGLVSCLAFTPDSKRLITGCTDDDYRCWDARTGKPCPEGLRDKEQLERASTESGIRNLTQLPRSGVTRTFTIRVRGKDPDGEEISGSGVDFSADGKRMVIKQERDNRPTLIVLDDDGKKLRELPQKDDNVEASLSPDGRTLAVAAADRLTFVDVDSGRSRHHALSTMKAVSHSFAMPPRFSPDGSRVAFLDGKNKVSVLSVRDGRLLAVIGSEDADRIWGLFFSPDGKTLCLGRYDGPQTFWEVASGQAVRSLSGEGCLFAPDNRLLAIRKDNALCLFDLYSGQALATCKGTAGFTDNVIFSPDGKRLAAACNDTTVLLWDTDFSSAAAHQSPLEEKTLERLWQTLKSENASAAYSAIGRLLADPQRSLVFLDKRLRKVAPVEEKRLRRWIADLDSESFQEREAASRELGQLGPLAENALRKALEGPTSPELRRRIRELLRPYEGKERRLSGAELAHVRAIQVLERIGTAEARRILQKLAEGAESLERTRDAQEALRRLQRRGR